MASYTLEETLMRYTVLLAETEKYGLALRGNVSGEMNELNEELLLSINNSLRLIKKHVDLDAAEEVGECISILMDEHLK